MRNFRAGTLAVAALIAGCSPYSYSEQTAPLSTSIGAVAAAYRAGAANATSDRLKSSRLEWAVARPILDMTPGCRLRASQRSDEVCLVRARPTQQAVTTVALPAPAPDRPAPDRPSRRSSDVCTEVAGTIDPRLQAVRGADDLAPVTRDQVVQSLSKYMEGLEALTKASDRAAYDAAAQKVAAAVASLGGTLGGLSSGAGAAVGPVLGASTNLALWVVGEALDARRYDLLERSTRAACWPVRILADVLTDVLGEQQRSSMTALVISIGAQINLLNQGRGRLSVAEYLALAETAQADATRFQLLRSIDIPALTLAIAETHDQLALAVHRRDGQFMALVESLTELGGLVNTLVAATRTPSK